VTEARTLDPTILREYDIRGIVGETLDADDVRAIGRGFGTLVRRGGGTTAAVGYDGRLTSPAFEAALTDGLVQCGLNVTRIGLGPSPMLYFATHTLPADAGIMITGSHNPPEYNGIKLVLGGHSFHGAQIQDLGHLIAAGDFVSGAGQAEEKSVTAAYVDRLAQDYAGTKPLTVAWDNGNGAAGEVLEALVARLPGRHVLLNETIDGTFPAHHPDPTVEANLEQLKEAVAAEQCDLGIAFDGDGDRIGIIDGQGRVLWGDQLLVILAAEVLAIDTGAPIIADVKASQAFFDEITRMGGEPVMWCAGHSLVKAKMAEMDAPLAGEMSGHIFFAKRFYGYYGFDDALYAAVRLLSIVSRSGESIAAMRDQMPQMINTPELRFDCAEDRKAPVIAEVKGRLAKISGIEVHDIDGVRVNTEDGWWLLRASNTQDVLVARCEASTEEGLERLKDTLAKQLRASGIEPPDFG
jgi:phosphomannomutase